MKFLAIIPARYASTRFPGKPLADIKGKPMIQHVYEKTSTVFDNCYVATDDSRIESSVKGFGGRVIMTSTEHRSGTDRCREALDKIEACMGDKFDVVVNIQGDEPFVSSEQFSLIKACFESPRTDIATLVKPFSGDENIADPNMPKVVLTVDDYALYFSRSVIPYFRAESNVSAWAANHRYLKHIGLYGYRSEILRKITALPQGELEKCESLEQLRWLENGFRIKVAHTASESISIDTPDDLKRALKVL